MRSLTLVLLLCLALTAPSRDLVAAIVGRRLLVHTARDAALGPVVLEVPLTGHETAVMAEWALGAHVDRWTRELGAAR